MWISVSVSATGTKDKGFNKVEFLQHDFLEKILQENLGNPKKPKIKKVSFNSEDFYHEPVKLKLGKIT